MKFLLVEDDALKSENIQSFLQSEFPLDEVTVARSFQSGRRQAESNNFDLLILDMTLPTYDVAPRSREGRTRSKGGRELMRKIKLTGISLKAIVVTQFSSFGEGPDAVTFDILMKECLHELPDVFLGGIFYKSSSENWKKELHDMMVSALAVK
jgi:DNA-binding NarL/FixJ family response regulator